MRRSKSRRGVDVRAIDIFIVALCLLTPALGGSTELWAQAVFTIGLGIALVWGAPRLILSRAIIGVFVALLLVACIGFLPATLFPTLEFRRVLADIHQTALPGTLSMQPWQSLESALLLGVGLTWIGFLFCHNWGTRRRQLLAIYVSGIAALASLALIVYFLGLPFPSWTPANGAFGFFPNRNQTGILLATAGVISFALAFRCLTKRDKIGYAWAACYVLFGWALTVNRDRLTLVLWILGSVLWLIWMTWQSGERRALGIGLSLALLIAGWELQAERWRTQKPNVSRPEQRLAQGSNANTKSSFDPHRPIAIQKDALQLLRDASWHGIGLGNFEPVFARYRSHSLAQDRIRHPENDWLWGGIEMGWLAPLLVAVGLMLTAAGRQVRLAKPAAMDAALPTDERSAAAEALKASADRSLRFESRERERWTGNKVALWVCVGLFIVDALFSVPAHRFGAIVPALFLLGLVRAGGKHDGSEEENRVRKTGSVMKALGVAWVAIGVIWLGSVFGFAAFPTSGQDKVVRQQLEDTLRQGAFDEAIQFANMGLRWAPLDWQLYFQRGLAQMYSQSSTMPALLDFNRARFLEPNAIQVPFEEARAWLAREPRLVFAPWVEVLRRAGDQKVEYFRKMLELGKGIDSVEEEMFSLTIKELDLLLVLLAHTNDREFTVELEKLLLDDPNLESLSAAQQRELFRLWVLRGDRKRFEEELGKHPEWLKNAWAGWARIQASRGELQGACELAQRYSEPPVLPVISSNKSATQLRQILLVDSNDFSTGFALYQAQMQADESGLALDTLGRLTSHPDCPTYFHFLEANLAMMKQQWQTAWQAWERYLNAGK